jgi:hypothetical protein
MMRWLSVLGLFVLGTSIWADDQKPTRDEKGSTKPKVVGLSIRKPLPAKPGEFSFNPAGTTLEVVVFQPGRFILGIDAKASKLEQFTDDKKTDLHKSKGLFGQANWINEFMSRPSTDGESCTVQIAGPNAPAKGAEKILLKGSVALKCGAGAKSTDKKDITLKMNEEATVGSFKVKVNSAAAFGSQLTISSGEPNIKSVEFLDDNGKAIMTGQPNRISLPTPGGKMEHMVGYFLTGKRDKVTVKINYFDKVENVTVPLDVRVGLDLE